MPIVLLKLGLGIPNKGSFIPHFKVDILKEIPNPFLSLLRIPVDIPQVEAIELARRQGVILEFEWSSVVPSLIPHGVEELMAELEGFMWCVGCVHNLTSNKNKHSHYTRMM